jgi:ABC-type sugar transport system substrate-binding protein
MKLTDHPRRSTRAALAVTGALALAVGATACGSSNSGSSDTSGGASTAASGGASTSAAAQTGAPYSVDFKWGHFDLSSRIADKLKSKEPLNFVLSYQILNQPGAPAQLTAGMKQGAAAVEKQYGVQVNTKLIGPPETDPPTQISQIRQQVASNQVDCGGVEPVTPGAFVSVINETLDKGVPMMTVNTDSPDSHRIAYFGANDDQEPDAPSQMGRVAGRFTVDWAKKNNFDLNGKQVALITGDTTASWAQARMQGWVDTIKQAYPDVQIVGSPSNALTTGYDPAEILNKMGAFMTGHPDVVFYYDSDWGAAEICQLIGRNKLKGKVATIGYNFSQTYIDDLQKGLIIATIDQRYDLQAKDFVLGCARFLLGKEKLDEFQFVDPSIWTPENVDKGVAVYKKIPNSGI